MGDENENIGVNDPENIEIDQPENLGPESGDASGSEVQANLAPAQSNVDLAGNAIPAQPVPPVGKAGVSISESHKRYPGAKSSVEIDPWALDPNAPLATGAAQMGEVNRAIGEAKAAEQQKADVTRQYEAGNADVLRRQQELERQWAGIDERTSTAAAAEAHKYIAAYQEQIAAVRQMAVDPTGPIGSMSLGEAAGMSLANFAQGFLAARYGIKIDVTGQIDKWVERSIHEQERRIQQAQAGAEDQLHLWEIARQTSRDDQEAKQRYRGWIIAGMQTSLQANAAQYKSDSANADAALAIAQLDMEGVKTKQAIWNNTFNQVKQNEVLKETHWFRVQQLSLDQEKIDLKAQLAQAKAAGKGLIPIDDPEHPGQPKWGVDPTDKVAVKEGLEARGAVGVVMKRMDELQEAYEKAYGKWGQNPKLLFGDALASPEVREYHRAQKAAALAIVDYGRARRYTETHVKNIMDLMPDEKGWQRGNNADAIDTIKENVRSDFENAMNTYSDEKFHGQIAMPKHASEHETRKAVTEGSAPVQTPVGAEEQAGEAGAGGVVPASTAWKKTMTEGVPQPESARAIDHLLVALADPAKFQRAAKESGFSEDTMLKDHRIVLHQAEAAIRRIAATSNNPYTRVYGQKVINALESGGTDALAELTTEVVPMESPEAIEIDQPEGR